MDRQLFEFVKVAIEASRQDEEALTLYWDFIQSESEFKESRFSEGRRLVLSGAYRLLYTTWQALNRDKPLDALVELVYQRRFSDVAVLSLIAEGEFQAGRYDNALKLYDRLLTLKALDTTGYQQLKLACFKHQPFNEFVNLLLQRCLEEHPDDVGIIQFLFSQYLLKEKYTYASFAPAIYQRILTREPGNLTAYSALCECYYRQGKYDQAITEGEASLQHDSHHPDILATLAKAHYERGEYGRVVTYCRDVLAKRPGRTDAQILLATVYAQNALTTSEAIKNYRLALRCDPQNLLLRLALFRSYLRKLQVNEAVEECEQIISALYEIYGASNRDFRTTVNEMISEYERAIRRAPGDISLYLITAKLYESIGHFHKSLIYYRTLLEMPLDTAIIHTLVELLEKLTTFQVQNPHLYLYLGLLYHKIERYDDAKLAFRVAMYSDLDEREVDDILVRHDRSIWRYPPVLVILAHHRIVTKDILNGLIQTFRQPDREDWKGVLWALQDLYDIDDLLLELRQLFTWESFSEIYHHILSILANNGSRHAVLLLRDLLAHPNEDIRIDALHTLIQMNQPLTEQSLSEIAIEAPYADIRLEVAGYYAQQFTEQATYHLMKMLHDEDVNVRLYVVQSLQEREIQMKNLRNVLFTERHPEVKVEIIKLFERSQEPEEWIYLAHLLNDVVAKQYHDSGHTHGKVYKRLKQLISHSEKPEEKKLLSALVRAVGNLRLEQGIYSLITIAGRGRSQQLRLEAIDAIGNIGSHLGMASLEGLLHAASESREIRIAAERALELIVSTQNAEHT